MEKIYRKKYPRGGDEYTIVFSTSSDGRCLGDLTRVPMNPCLREHFAQGNHLGLDVGQEWLADEDWGDDIHPLLDNHAPGCSGNCYKNPLLNLPKVFVWWGITGVT